MKNLTNKKLTKAIPFLASANKMQKKEIHVVDANENPSRKIENN
jgi:hypothetical protein